MQDYNPNHIFRLATLFFSENSIHCWKIPESPDLNSQNLWHEMEFLQRKVKPQTKEELISGIHQFWGTVTVEKCSRYIRHLRKVIPRVVAKQGGPTGY